MDSLTDIPPATARARCWAYLIDATLLAILGGMVTIFSMNMYFTAGLGWLIPAAYFILQQGSAMGATLGQRLLKIRVATIFAEPLTLGQACIRYVIFSLPFLPLTVFELTPAYITDVEDASGMLEMLLRGQSAAMLPEAVKTDLGLVGGGLVISILLVLPILFRSDRRAVYDLLSGAVVLKNSTDS